MTGQVVVEVVIDRVLLMTSFFRFQKALASWLLQWHVAEVRNLEALLLLSGKFAGPRGAVNTLSQARRHSWGHSQITRQLVNMRQRGPSGRDEDHFLALMALNDVGAGQAAGTNWGKPGIGIVHLQNYQS